MIYGYNERAIEGAEVTIKLSTGRCEGCEALFSTKSYVHLTDEHAESFELLRTATELGELSALNEQPCPSCGHVTSGAHPFSLDLTEQGRLLCVVPSTCSLWALEMQAMLLSALSAREHVTPKPYFAHPQLCVGVEALKAALKGEPLLEVDLSPAPHQAQALPKKQLTPQPKLAPKTLTTAKASAGAGAGAGLDPLDALIDAALDQEPTGVYEMSQGTPAPVHLSQQLDALDPMNPSTLPPSLPETSQGEAGLSNTAVELLEAAGGAPMRAAEVTRVDVDFDADLKRAAEAPTQIPPLPSLAKKPAEPKADNTVVQDVPPALSEPQAAQEEPLDPPSLPLDALEDALVDVGEPTSAGEGPSTQLLYSSSMRRFDHQLAGTANTYLSLNDEGNLEASALLDERQAEGWLLCDLEVRAQLHLVEGGAAPCLTLFSVQDGEIEDEIFWPIRVDGPLGPSVLRTLRRQFRFELHLYKKNGNHYGARTIEAPLEENIGYILSAIKRLQMTPKQAAEALLKVSAEDFDREGKMKHSFEQGSFAEISSASEAKLAVGIWGYWSTVKQRDYLLFVKSFPLPWLRRIQHRVLKAGLDFGLALPPHMQSQTVALKLAKSEVELLQRAVANFAEVSLKLKPSQLSAVEEWENWDALLAQLEERGVHIDEELELLALQAMERAGLSGDSLFGELEPEPAASALPTHESVDLADIEEVSDLSLDELGEGSQEGATRSDAGSVEWVSDELIEEELVSAELLELDELDEALIVEEELIEEELDELEVLDDSLDSSSDGEA